MSQKSEYALSGVDYSKMNTWKRLMVEMGKKTYGFPLRHDVEIDHGGVHRYIGPHKTNHGWKQVTEGLGNKNWIAAWMDHFSGEKQSFHTHIGEDTVRMATNDLLPFRALPAIYTDEVASGKDSWFSENPERNLALRNSFFLAAREDGFAIPQGESPALKYLINTKPEPLDLPQGVPFHCPSFSGCVVGIIAPYDRWSKIKPVRAGDIILGALSPEWGANGASLMIKRVMQLPEQFLTKLRNGKTFGEQALTPVETYVPLCEQLFAAGIEIHHMQPVTGDGIAKVARYPIPFLYYIHTWAKSIPLTCEYLRGMGVSTRDCYMTYNMGIGLVLIVPRREVARTLKIGKDKLIVLGEVRKTATDAHVILGHEHEISLWPSPEE